MAQIDRFRVGDLRLVGSLTMLPTYHAVMAALAHLVGASSLDAIRLLTLLLSSALIVGVFLIARTTAPARAGLRTIQILFLPILFPLLFLVYTDVTALLFVCAGVLAMLHRRFLLAGLLAGASVAVRQTEIIWLCMTWALCLNEIGGASPTRAFVSRAVRSTWTFALAAVAFAAFVVWNRGVALGDRSMHPAGELHVGNLYFLLFLFFLLLLPLCVHWSFEAFAFVRSRIGWIAGLSLAALYFLVVFDADHPYNQLRYRFFLHNQLIQTFTATPLARLAFSAAAAMALLVIVVTLQRSSFRLLCVATVLSLLPIWMIEPRYYLAPLTLFLLFRKEEPRWLELTLCVWEAVIAVWLLRGIAAGRFFL